MTGRLALAAFLAAALATRAAIAEGTETSREALVARSYDRPYTLAQLGAGLLTLPSADVCLKGSACKKGDRSIEANFWQLYRANRAFAIGAGATVALKATTDNPPSAADIDRSHTRSYFLVEAAARYYWFTPGWMEAWIGATVGGVIVSDRYSSNEPDPSNVALIGPGSATIRTEGGTVGALLGAQWTFAANWSAGLQVRYARWFLPNTPATNAFLDRATLTGSQGMLDFGILCSYRIAL
jgi:hypothetical protein